MYVQCVLFRLKKALNDEHAFDLARAQMGAEACFTGTATGKGFLLDGIKGVIGRGSNVVRRLQRWRWRSVVQCRRGSGPGGVAAHANAKGIGHHIVAAEIHVGHTHDRETAVGCRRAGSRHGAA